MSDTVKRRPGRPRKSAEEAKRAPITITTTARMRERIDASAQESGRSRTQEIERRLEQSFMLDDMATSLATRALLSFVQLAAETLEWQQGASWTENADVALQLAGAITFYIDRNRPRAQGEINYWAALDLFQMNRLQHDRGEIDAKTLEARDLAITNALAAHQDYVREAQVRGTNSLAELENLFSTKGPKP